MSYQDLIPLIFAEIVGDFGYKEFANKGGIKNFAFGTIGYLGVVYYLIRCLQGSQVLIVNAAWDGLSALIESASAMLFLGERFENPLQYVGICFIIAGLFFLKLPIINEKKFVFPKLFLQ
jgi:multidrug transporter EmrE-like cation transporter